MGVFWCILVGWAGSNGPNSYISVKMHQILDVLDRCFWRRFHQDLSPLFGVRSLKHLSQGELTAASSGCNLNF